MILALREKGLNILFFYDRDAEIWFKENVINIVKLVNGLYELQTVKNDIAVNAINLGTWHKRFAHLEYDNLRKAQIMVINIKNSSI